ncbi:hypothetical protein CJ030_MR6G001849 [Morella rubra]|uniref:Uncharacterized protein n=1 Tax=Morella rubra TaxID=262757 RepID=A0A6A1VA26_9ROSI|nr:hypothetical protein CJ030_MR6G001849 [Morella rubra]
MAPRKRPSASSDSPPFEASIMVECERAFTALQRGKHSKALRLVKESISRHSRDDMSVRCFAILHATLGVIHFKTAALIDDSNTKRKHLNNAAEAARQAIAFNKNSLQYSFIYAKVLFELAAIHDENKGYQEVIQECERALMIEDPTDPMEDWLLKDDFLLRDLPLVTKESRIEFMKNKVKRLIEKCNNVHDANSEEADFEEEECNSPSETDEEMMALHEKGRRSLDNESNIGHLKSEHDMGSLSAMYEANVPEVAANDCVEVVENGVWKPVDTVASIQIMENSSKFESCDAGESDSADKGIDNTQDCHSIVKENDPEVLLTWIDKFQRWPLCDDSKRTELLQRIHGALQSLLRNGCLSATHVNEVISFTTKMMINRIPFEQIDDEGLNATLLFTCFLEEASHLEPILEFLEELATSCGLGGLSGDHILDDKLRGPQEFCAKVRIVFSGDFSHLFLDERLLSEELRPTSFQDTTADDGTALTSAVEIRESDKLPDGDAFVNWLMTGPAIGRAKRVQNSLEYDPESSEPLLWKLQKDLEANGDPMIDIFDLETINSKFTLISDIFKGQVDSTYREERIQWLQGQLVKWVGIPILSVLQHHKLDARILAIMAIMRQTEQKLGVVSSYDYRSIMVHLLKSFLQAQVEHMFDKDTNEKSDAAIEALLEELALDSQKIWTVAIWENRCYGNRFVNLFVTKHFHLSRRQLEAMRRTFLSTKKKHNKVHDENYQSPEIDIRVNTDELKQPQEELSPENDDIHHVEERMLAEALEYQINFENEAQIKLLAEQNMSAFEAIGEYVKDTVSVVSSGTGEGPAGSSAPQQPKDSLFCSSIPFGSLDWADYCRSHSQSQTAPADEESVEGHEQPKHSEPTDFN